MTRGIQNAFSKRKLLVSLIIVTVAVVLGIVLLFLYFRKGPQAPLRPLDVQVVKAEQRDVPIYSEWIATTDGMVNADIKAQVTGYLLKQDYKEGSFVRKGQLLFELDRRPFQAALDQAKGQVAQYQGQIEQATYQATQAEAQAAQANGQLSQARAQLSQTQANQLRSQFDENKYRPLVAQQAVTQQDYDNALQANQASKAQVDSAKAGVETARAQLRAAEAQIGNTKAAIASAKGQLENAKAVSRSAEIDLGFTRIVAPIDGIAGIAQAQVGDLITTSSSPLTTVSTVDPLKVYFTLSEQEYLNFRKLNLIDTRGGASVTKLELELILADGTSFPNRGSLFFADRQVDPQTGAIRLAGLFSNPGNVLRPGQYGRVRARTSLKEGAVLVPQRAVSQLQGGDQIAVVKGDNSVEIRNVKVGDRVDTMWIIDDGLKPGENVVVEGTQKVRSGAVVNPQPVVAMSSAPG